MGYMNSIYDYDLDHLFYLFAVRINSSYFLKVAFPEVKVIGIFTSTGGLEGT
jgi:hypothetical protein